MNWECSEALKQKNLSTILPLRFQAILWQNADRCLKLIFVFWFLRRPLNTSSRAFAVPCVSLLKCSHEPECLPGTVCTAVILQSQAVEAVEQYLALKGRVMEFLSSGTSGKLIYTVCEYPAGTCFYMHTGTFMQKSKAMNQKNTTLVSSILEA